MKQSRKGRRKTTAEEIQGSQIRKVHVEIPLAEKEKEKQSWKEF